MLMIDTKLQLRYFQVLCLCTFFSLFLSVYIVNVVSKHVYIILIGKKKLPLAEIKAMVLT